MEGVFWDSLRSALFLAENSHPESVSIQYSAFAPVSMKSKSNYECFMKLQCYTGIFLQQTCNMGLPYTCSCIFKSHVHASRSFDMGMFSETSTLWYLKVHVHLFHAWHSHVICLWKWWFDSNIFHRNCNLCPLLIKWCCKQIRDEKLFKGLLFSDHYFLRVIVNALFVEYVYVLSSYFVVVWFSQHCEIHFHKHCVSNILSELDSWCFSNYSETILNDTMLNNRPDSSLGDFTIVLVMRCRNTI